MLDYLRDVRPGLKLGGGVSLGTSSITEVEPGELLATGLVPGSGGGQVLGAGFTARYDTRNNVSYPVRGVFHQLSWRLYDAVLGADYSLNTTSLDLRGYLPLGDRRVLALRALGVANGGTVPFQVMPALGGDQLMRGYFGGRFRERQLVAGQAEFRTYVWKRLGLAAFGAVGQVARDLDGLGMGRFHYSYGAGLRILLIKQEQMNLRMDFGFGEDQSGFYLGFAEVF
jgi:outer membrane protein assembly factor BamA